jgi:hypothetical protein
VSCLRPVALFCGWMSGAHALIAIHLDRVFIMILAVGGAICSFVAYIMLTDDEVR